MHLGEPDGTAPDESWVSYGSAIGQGGVGVALVALSTGPGGAAFINAERILYRRLVMRFDERGVVTTASIDTKVCPKYKDARSCLDEQGGDLAATDVIAVDGGSLQEYARASLWVLGFHDVRGGTLTITRESLVFVNSPDNNTSAAVLRIPFTEIESVSVDSVAAYSFDPGVRAMPHQRRFRVI